MPNHSNAAVAERHRLSVEDVEPRMAKLAGADVQTEIRFRRSA